MAEKELTIEQVFTQLEDVIKGMEKEDVSLEESFGLYHQGIDLLRTCSEKIDKVEKQMLVLDDEGETHEFDD